MTKVEPSGDDTLTEILRSFGASLFGGNDPDDVDELELKQAHAQLLQYIEGVIGSDKPHSADCSYLVAEAAGCDCGEGCYNELRAEQRQRLRG